MKTNQSRLHILKNHSCLDICQFIIFDQVKETFHAAIFVAFRGIILEGNSF